MASYIYSKVQEAIGGNSASSGFQKNWSPNKIRALYIMRNFILVVDYLSGPKITWIDENEVGLDLQNPNRIGSINNLLSSRQLSCLEEIYADEVFSRFPNVLDLQAYASSVVNSASRLRYYAYTVIPKGDELYKILYQAFSNGLVDFTYARNVGGIRVVDTGNTDWYRKHNLRPQYYGPDASGGQLASWFNKVERVVSSYAEKEKEKLQELKNYGYIMKRVSVDMAEYPVLLKLRSLMKYCLHSGIDFYKGFYQIANEQMRSYKPVPGLSKELVIKAAQSTGNNQADFIKGIQNISSYYEYAGIYLKDAPFDIEKLDKSGNYTEETGFLNVADLLDRILSEVYVKYCYNAVCKYTLHMAIMNAFPEGIPKGHLSQRVPGSVKTTSRSPRDYVGSYFSAFLYICGVSEEGLKVWGESNDK